MRILIVGAGRLGRLLASDLLEAGHDVRTMDGSPLDEAALAAAAEGCDALACVSDDDNLNAVVALAARRRLRVPLALAVVANPSRAEALAGLGAHVVCPTTRIAQQLHMALVRSGVETELVLGGDVGIYRVDAPARLAGRALSEVERPGEIVPVAVERGPRRLLATPGLRLEEGDVLHLAASHRDLVSDLVRP